MRKLNYILLAFVSVFAFGDEVSNEDLKQAIQNLQIQLSGSYNAINARLETLELAILGTGNTQPTPEPEKRVEPYEHQYLMAPHIRNFETDVEMHQWAKNAKAWGFDGLHTNVRSAWFSLTKNDFGDLPSELCEPALERLWILATVCEAHEINLHFWIWGDVQNDLHPSVQWGDRSKEEQAVYAWIKEKFAGLDYVTVGLGFDCEEWVDADYAQWVVSQMEGVKLSIRHPEGLFDDIASIPSRMHRRPTEGDFKTLREQYPYGMVMSEDRFRNQPLNSSSSGHIDLPYQREIWTWAKAYKVSCIWGNCTEEHYRHDDGSNDYYPNWQLE